MTWNSFSPFSFEARVASPTTPLSEILDQRSMKLNDQWRLVLEFEGDGPEKVVWVVAIEDYH